MVVVVWTTLVGEPFRHEHVAFLRRCKQHGDVLVVGVGDRPGRVAPRQTVEQRGAVVAACRYVDRVVLDAPSTTTHAVLARHGVDLVVPSPDDQNEGAMVETMTPTDLVQMRMAQMNARLDRVWERSMDDDE